MSTLAPVDVEAAAVVVLGAAADHVSTALPPAKDDDPWPPSLIRVTRTGGGGLNLIQSTPTLLVECYASGGSPVAFGVARVAYGRLLAARDSYWTPDVYVSRVEADEPVNYPDPDAPNHHRYQFMVSVTTSLEAL